VRLSKRVRLLRELWGLFESCQFRARGKSYRTDWGGIIAALTKVVNSEKYGFTNHNYLKCILAQEAERLSAEGLTAKEEEARERARREGRPRAGAQSKRTGRREKGLESFRSEMGVRSLSAYLWPRAEEDDEAK